MVSCPEGREPRVFGGAAADPPWAVSNGSVPSAPGLRNSPLSPEQLSKVTEDGNPEASLLCHKPSELASLIK